MEQVHNKKKRMPLILTEQLAREWIREELSEARIQEIAGFQFPAEQMAAYTIEKSFRNSGDPAQPFVYEQLPAIIH
jgi:hypothetical protein